MNQRTTLVLAVILASLLAGSYIVSQQQNSAPTPVAPRYTLWLDLTKFQISNISIVDAATGQKLAASRSADASWTLQAPIAGPADSQKLEAWLTQWEYMSTQYVITPTAGLDEFGLSRPALVITLTAQTGETTIVHIGGQPPAVQGYYARRLPDNTVVVARTGPVEETRALLQAPPVPPPPTLGAPAGP